MQWHDKREVIMLSTLHTGKMMTTGKVNYRTGEVIKKSDLVIDYTANMRLVDKADMMVIFVECVRKTVRWYNKLFMHLIDITLLNAYNFRMIRSGNRPTSLKKFTYAVSYQLLEKYGEQNSPHPGRHSLLKTCPTVWPVQPGYRGTVWNLSHPHHLLPK